MSSNAGPVSRVLEGPWADWLCWRDPVPDTFLNLSIGPSYSRRDGEHRAIVMLETCQAHANRSGALHGGFLAAFADHAYFAALAAMGHPDQAAAVTVDLSIQYCGSGKVGQPLQADVEVLQETGRLFFMRLTLEQDGSVVAASSATVRKARKLK